jgi:metal-dependent amidase/aminoacylase/carboxypeptidase family protein
MQHLQDQINILSEQYFEETVAMRRYLHQHPELSEQEFNTAIYIKDRLKQYGI